MITPVSLPDACKMLNVPRKVNPPPKVLELSTPSITFGGTPVKTLSLCKPIQPALRVLSGWMICVSYVIHGALAAMLFFLESKYTAQIMTIISPFWIVTLFLHVSAIKGFLMTFVGSILILFYPLFIVLEDETLWACYLLFFISFCTRGTKEKGVWLVCVVVCWVVALCAAVATMILQTKFPSKQLLFTQGVACFTVAAICSRPLSHMSYKVTMDD